MRFCTQAFEPGTRRPAPRLHVACALVLLVSAASACATLEGLRAFVQPPRFEQDDRQRSEIRLNGTSGAAVRIWTRVSNPNPFGLTLGTLSGSLRLEGAHAATVNFPFGLPLQPHGEGTVPSTSR